MLSTVSLKELCIHQVCTWKQGSFPDSLDCFTRNGLSNTVLWKPLVDDTGMKKANINLRDSDVTAVSMCPLVLFENHNEYDGVSREKNTENFWKMQ